MWFEHPENSFSGFWREHIVTKGPDVLFDVYEDTPNRITLFCTEFFGKLFTVVSILKSNPYQAEYRRVIDEVNNLINNC